MSRGGGGRQRGKCCVEKGRWMDRWMYWLCGRGVDGLIDQLIIQKWLDKEVDGWVSGEMNG